MAKAHFLTTVAQDALAEIAGDAPELAKRLFGEGSPDATTPRKAEFLAIVAEEWPDPQFRSAYFDQLAPPVDGPDGKTLRPKDGVRRFLEVYRDLVEGGYIPRLPPPEWAPPPPVPVNPVMAGVPAPVAPQLPPAVAPAAPAPVPMAA